MLIGTARPIETRTLEVQGESLAEIRQQLDAQTPPGFTLTDAPALPVKGSTKLTAVGTFRRRDGLRTVEADTFEQLRAKIPDGWQLITVRAL